MQVRCPGCRAVYKIKDVDDDAILVCHQCSTEFNLEDGKKLTHDASGPEVSADPFIASSNPIEKNQSQIEVLPHGQVESETEPDFDNYGLEPPDPYLETSSEPASEKKQGQKPIPAQQRAWPWLLVFLCAAIGAGLWLNKDSWMERPWVRSFMINNGYRVIIHDRDWRLISESVKAQWIERTNHTLVLLIEGRVENRLQSTLPPPAIRISLLSGEKSEQKTVQEILKPITMNPLGNAIRRVPFITPPEDTMPVISSGTRGFILILENVPDKAQSFTLGIAAHQL